MRIDRSHIPWFLFVTIATVAAAFLFLANFYPQTLPFQFSLPAFFGEAPPKRNTFGGTPLGLIFGAVSYLIFLFAAALGIRKKRRLWRIGHVQFWLKAHIWLSVLSIPLVLLHCGFHMGGSHTTGLMLLFGWVMGSGFFGLAMQQVMPKLMRDSLPREVVFEQIPHLRQRIHDAAKKLSDEVSAEAAKPAAAATATQPAPAAAPVAAAPETTGVAEAVPAGAVAIAEADPSLGFLREFLDEECLPYLSGKVGRLERLGNPKTAEAIFRLLALNVSEKYQGKVSDLRQWCEERRAMDRQARLHHWLHGWLLIHVPTSFGLLVYGAWHAWVAVRYLLILPN